MNAAIISAQPASLNYKCTPLSLPERPIREQEQQSLKISLAQNIHLEHNGIISASRQCQTRQPSSSAELSGAVLVLFYSFSEVDLVHSFGTCHIS